MNYHYVRRPRTQTHGPQPETQTREYSLTPLSPLSPRTRLFCIIPQCHPPTTSLPKPSPFSALSTLDSSLTNHLLPTPVRDDQTRPPTPRARAPPKGITAADPVASRIIEERSGPPSFTRFNAAPRSQRPSYSSLAKHTTPSYTYPARRRYIYKQVPTPISSTPPLPTPFPGEVQPPAIKL